MCCCEGDRGVFKDALEGRGASFPLLLLAGLLRLVLLLFVLPLLPERLGSALLLGFILLSFLLVLLLPLVGCSSVSASGAGDIVGVGFSARRAAARGS